MKHVELADEQARSADTLVAWARYTSGARGCAGARGPRDGRVRALRGLAGTGKTTVAAEIARRLATVGTRVAVVAPTGKAAHVLRTKGIAATTIHAAAYQLVGDGADGPEFILRRGITGDPDVVICDEASMATNDHLIDLLSRVPKVLLVGDPGQLPPVSGTPVLHAAEGVDLLQVHRQAMDSGVVRFAHAIRAGASLAAALKVGAPDVVAHRPPHLPGVVLVSRNDTRVRTNAGIRKQVHGSNATAPWPVAGDRVVCLTNHSRAAQAPRWDDDTREWCDAPDPWCNGTVGDVVRRADDASDSTAASAVYGFVALCDDGLERPARAWLQQLTAGTLLQVDEWDRSRMSARFAWGWALTTHKAQGSEWDEVAVLEDGFGSADELRAWRYTAATRAATKLWWAV